MSNERKDLRRWFVVVVAVFILAMFASDSHAGFLTKDMQRLVRPAPVAAGALRVPIERAEQAVAAKHQAVAGGGSSADIQRAANAIDAAAKEAATTGDSSQNINAELKSYVDQTLKNLADTRMDYSKQANIASRYDTILRWTVFLGAGLSALVLGLLPRSRRGQSMALVLSSLAALGQGADSAFGVSDDCVTLKRCAQSLEYNYRACSAEIQDEMMLRSSDSDLPTRIVTIASRCREQERKSVELAVPQEARPIAPPIAVPPV